jgi:hypothetical protein
MRNIQQNRFYQHKINAERRGVEFKFTFDEWVKMWEDSGKWDERGWGSEKYCMARHNDTGPYSIDNVSIQTNKENNQFSVTHRDHNKWLPAIIEARKDPIWKASISGTGNSQFKGDVKGTCKKTGVQIILSGKNQINNAGFTHGHVYKCINGHLKSHKGYTWERI